MSDCKTDNSNVVDSLRRSKSRRLRDISNDKCYSNKRKSNVSISEHSPQKHKMKNLPQSPFTPSYNILSDTEKEPQVPKQGKNQQEPTVENKEENVPQSRMQQIKNKFGS